MSVQFVMNCQPGVKRSHLSAAVGLVCLPHEFVLYTSTGLPTDGVISYYLW